jgi:hypothetical protein
MSDEQTYQPLELVGYRVPDYTTETAGDGTKHAVELPGIYRIGVLVEGHFVEVTAFKAGLLTNSAAQAAQGRERDRKQAADAERELREREAAEQTQAGTTATTDTPSG